MKRNLSGNGRRGSALIIVLGILSVLMLLAVAFATFERTERGGTTNLKNAFVARNSLATAVGRVIEAIDVSFDSPAGDDPVAPWPHPWLASAGDPMLDYLQSATRPAGSGDNANVLTADIAQYLSPAQLALVKAAKCNWAPIHGSISASPAGGGERAYGGTYGDAGRPEKDDLIGRYAFVVLETTGLADLNMTGTGSDTDAARLARKTNANCRASAFLIPYGDAKDSQNNPVEPFLADPEELPANRAFSSLADAIGQCAAGTFVTSKADIVDIVNSSSQKYYPADLFAGFAPSLSDLDPEGFPKVRLPSYEEFNGWDEGQVGSFAAAAFVAMSKIFAHSREEAELGAGSVGKDEIKIFEKTNAEYSLTRELLATVAMLDGMDADNRPGWFNGKKGLYDYLDAFRTVPKVSVCGTTVNETTLSATAARVIGGAHLNFPCTESSALLSSVIAHVDEVEDLEPDAEPGEGVRKSWRVKISVQVKANCPNKTEDHHQHNSKLEMSWAFADDDDPAWESVVLEGDGGRDAPPRIDWSEAIDWRGSGGEDTASPDDIAVDGCDRYLIAVDEQEFTVYCDSKPELDQNGEPVTDDEGNVVYDGFYPPTRAEYENELEPGSYSDAFLPIRVSVTITDTVNGNTFKTQQVPAPALESLDADLYKIHVNPGIYHNPEVSTFRSGMDVQGVDGSVGHLSYGWAFCLAPVFAFDTTSLAKPGETRRGFWVGDEAARGYDDPNDDRPGGALCPGLEELLWAGGRLPGENKVGDPNDRVVSWGDVNDRANGEFVPQFMVEWLLAPGSVAPDPVAEWLDSDPDEGHVPDFRHTASKGGSCFAADPSGDTELYTWIPAKGYASPAELGMVMCGPHETLSIFKTWRKGRNGTQPDFHRVLDYFTTDEDRYPNADEVEGETSLGSGTVSSATDWSELSGSVGKDQGDGTSKSSLLFSGVRNGRVNLNAPFLVKCTKPTGIINENNPPIRGDATGDNGSGRRNPYPIATVFNGAPLFRWVNANENAHNQWGRPEQIVTLREADAFSLARLLCKAIENLSTNEEENVAVAHRFTDDDGSVVRRRAVRNLSVIGKGDRNANDLLSNWISIGGWRKLGGNDENRKPENDYEREGLLRGVAGGFTTRGQTFLAIIRADAYSPKFGENSSAEDGTTLATTHALVELFRDPVPARTPEGTMPSDGSTRPVSFHNWYIRSFRVF